MNDTVSRRNLLQGRIDREETSYISSAVVSVLPMGMADVMNKIRQMPGTEISSSAGHKLVVLMEAADRDELGARLVEISLLEGVLSANMAFEASCGTDE